jgi:hypothetical protein
MAGLAAALYARCMAGLLDAVIAALSRVPSLRGGVGALIEAYLGFARERCAAMLFIHASADAISELESGRRGPRQSG